MTGETLSLSLILSKSVTNHASSADISTVAGETARRAGLAKVEAVKVEAIHALRALFGIGCVALQAVADACALHTLRTHEDIAESLSTVSAGKIGVACGVQNARRSTQIGTTVARQAD